MNKYPIEFKKGKLVKYPKPCKPTLIPKGHSKYINFNYIRLADLIAFADEKGASYDDVTFNVYRSYDDYVESEMCATVPLSPKEIEDMEKEYQKDLKAWEKWEAATKEELIQEQQKNAEKRLKALQTQERNLKAKLAKIEEQKNKL